MPQTTKEMARKHPRMDSLRREIEEINHPMFPRERLSPMAELDMMDVAVRRQGHVECHACRLPDPGTHPAEEPTTSPIGMEGNVEDPAGGADPAELPPLSFGVKSLRLYDRDEVP